MSYVRALSPSVLPTLRSEQTAKVRRGISASAPQFRMDCANSEREGAANSTRPPRPAISSAIRNDASVLPVPQAIIILPRSCASNPSITSVNALTWWGRSCLRDSSCRGADSSSTYESQSTATPSRPNRSTRWTGGSTVVSALSALALHSVAVVKIYRST